MGIVLPVYLLIGVVLMGAMFLGAVPSNMIGALAFMIYFGGLLNLIGDKIPFINKYLGGGPIVVIFGAAAVVYFLGKFPQVEAVNETISTFMKGGGFLDFYIAALITGSILGMDRELLKKAAIRYLPAILGGVIVAILLAGLGGYLVGFNFKESTAYISIPIMGGGMGAGAVPLSEIFGSGLGVDPADVLSRMVPAVALGNALSIVSGGLLDRLGKVKPEWSGDGQLVRMEGQEIDTTVTEDVSEFPVSHFGIGIAIATAFFIFGMIISKFIPQVHNYAWMIIAVAIVKVLDIMPDYLERACARWYQFVAGNFTSALLIGIGVAYTDLGQIIESFSLQYLFIVFLTVLGAMIGAGGVGYLVGFYPIESAITAGLCMSNMGGTGDVATLSAANRMELMPFAQISSRIGGAFILLLATGLMPFLFN